MTPDLENPAPLDAGNASLGTGALDVNIDNDRLYSRTTHIHLLNEAILHLQQLHDQIAKEKRKLTGQKLRDVSMKIFRLKTKLRKPGTLQEKEEIKEEINQLQHDLSSDLEAKDLAANTSHTEFLHD